MIATSFTYVQPKATRAIAEVFTAYKFAVGNRVGTYEEHAAGLKKRKGDTIQLDTPDQEPSLIRALAEACDRSGAPYLGTVGPHESGTWPSGKPRMAPGFVLLNITGKAEDRREMAVPFEAGSVTNDPETLMAAGIPEDEALEILARFDLAPDSPAPRF